MKRLTFGHCCCMSQPCTVRRELAAMLKLSCKECLSLNMYTNCAKGSPLMIAHLTFDTRSEFEVFKLLFKHRRDKRRRKCRRMSWGLQTDYHLVSAVINACSLLVLYTDTVTASLTVPICRSLNPRNPFKWSLSEDVSHQKRVKKRPWGLGFCLFVLHINIYINGGRLQKQTSLTVCSW